MNLYLPAFLLSIVLSLAACSSNTPADDSAASSPPAPDEQQTAPPALPAETASVKTFEVIAKQWEFIPETITVTKGDTVRLIIDNVDVSHGIAIPAFGVSEPLLPGKVTEVEFVADQAGTFTFFCNVYCGTGHGNMRGTLVVEE